jgi:hypothetical protein
MEDLMFDPGTYKVAPLPLGVALVFIAAALAQLRALPMAPALGYLEVAAVVVLLVYLVRWINEEAMVKLFGTMAMIIFFVYQILLSLFPMGPRP